MTVIYKRVGNNKQPAMLMPLDKRKVLCHVKSIGKDYRYFIDKRLNKFASLHRCL